MKKKTIASFAVDLIFEVGSSTVFTLTGGMAMFINNAVANHPRLKSVYCHHEQACVAAAEGYAKASNFTKAGFAVVTAGPGVSNTLTPLISAYGDSTPLIILAGQIKSEDIDTFGTRTHGIQEINSKAVISPVVKKFIRK
jgi:acetolactate synthase-1/2/3 large subunit